MPSTRSAFYSVLVCLLFAGCGGTTPQAPVVADSVPSPATAMPPPVIQPETMARPRAADTVRASVQQDTLPTIVARAFPKAASLQRLARPFPHCVVRDRDNRVLGYGAFSDSTGTTARGYAGTVPVQVFFDARGKPVRIYVLDNCETPAYMDLVLRAGLLDSLLVCDPAKPESVDAVTLATSSSHAITAGVTALAARVAAEIAGKPEGQR